MAVTNEEQKYIEELYFWLRWTAARIPGNETEILYTPNQLGAIIINLN